MGNANLNIGTLNDAVGTFGIEIEQKNALFNVGSPEYVCTLKDGSAKVLEKAFERHGADAMTPVLALLNVTFLSLGETRAAIVDALKSAAETSPDRVGIVNAVMVLAA